MDTQQWLEWLRGTGLQISIAVFVLGLSYRVLHLLLLGHKPNFAEARGSAWRGGLRTVWHRSLPLGKQTARGYLILGAGYLFHLGFLIALLFLSQHIELFRSVLGLSWPALPPAWITMATVLALAAMVALLAQRMIDPVRRLLSDFQDYLTWSLTFLPLLTGLLLKQSGGASYPHLLALHIASVELLLLAIPFTKLAHIVTTFSARWYNGAIAGYKGLKV